MPTHNRIIRCFSRRTIAFIASSVCMWSLIYALATGLNAPIPYAATRYGGRMGTGRAKHAPPPPPLPPPTFSPRVVDIPRVDLDSMSRLTTRAPIRDVIP